MIFSKSVATCFVTFLLAAIAADFQNAACEELSPRSSEVTGDVLAKMAKDEARMRCDQTECNEFSNRWWISGVFFSPSSALQICEQCC